MITIIEAKFSHYSDGGVSVNTYLMAGLSSDSDTKPTTEDVGNGSCYIEMDTSKVWFYDEGSTTWLEWGAESNAESNAASTLSMTRPSLTLGNTMSPDVEGDMPDAAEEEMPEVAEEMPDTADTTEDGEGE